MNSGGNFAKFSGGGAFFTSKKGASQGESKAELACGAGSPPFVKMSSSASRDTLVLWLVMVITPTAMPHGGREGLSRPAQEYSP